MNKQPNNFILIIDADGDVRESFSGETSHEEVLQICSYYEQADEVATGTYAAWKFLNGQFEKLSSSDTDEFVANRHVVDVFSIPLHKLENDEEYLSWRSKLVQDPYVMSGKLTYPGTRITVSNIMSLIRSGVSSSELELDYPSLTRRDLEYTKLMCQEIYENMH